MHILDQEQSHCLFHNFYQMHSCFTSQKNAIKLLIQSVHDKILNVNHLIDQCFHETFKYGNDVLLRMQRREYILETYF